MCVGRLEICSTIFALEALFCSARAITQTSLRSQGVVLFFYEFWFALTLLLCCEKCSRFGVCVFKVSFCMCLCKGAF